MFFNMLAFSLKMPEGWGQAANNLGGMMTNEINSTGHIGDILVLLTAIIMIIIYGLFLENHNMIMALFGNYIGLLAAIFYPYESWKIGGVDMWLAKIIVFAAVFWLTILFLFWARPFRIYYKNNFLVRWAQAIISAVLHAGLLVSIILSFLPVNFLSQFSENFLVIFLGDIGRLCWLIIPVIGLIFLRKKKRGFSGPKYED